MLARRMLTFMAVLLLLTAVAAAFAPPPPREPGEIATLGPGPTTAGSEVVEKELDAGDRKRSTITVEQGDRLSLEVTGSKLDAVELRGLGGIKPLVEGGVVSFDVLTDEPGRYPVVLTLSEPPRTLAIIEVVPRPREGLAPLDALTERRREA